MTKEHYRPGLLEESVEEKRILEDDPLQILIACSICHKSEAAIFQTDEDYCLDCWQEMTHPKI